MWYIYTFMASASWKAVGYGAGNRLFPLTQSCVCLLRHSLYLYSHQTNKQTNKHKTKKKREYWHICMLQPLCFCCIWFAVGRFLHYDCCWLWLLSYAVFCSNLSWTATYFPKMLPTSYYLFHNTGVCWLFFSWFLQHIVLYLGNARLFDISCTTSKVTDT